MLRGLLNSSLTAVRFRNWPINSTIPPQQLIFIRANKEGSLLDVKFLRENCIHHQLFQTSIIPVLKNKSEMSLIYQNHVDINILKFLQQLFKCSISEASIVYQNNQDHLELKMNETRVLDCFHILIDFGFSRSTLKENFWIFLYEKEQLSSKLKLYEAWNFKNPNNGIDILRLPFMKVLKYTKQTQSEFKLLDGLNRVTYFASFLQCDEKRVCELFMKYNFMMTINVKSFKNILDMVKDQEVATEDLLNDLWLFRYSPQFISNRIKFLNEIGAKQKCKTIKPWMLRCTVSTFNRYFELREENLAALGTYSNITDLLSNELSLTSAEVKEMILKHPPLAKISYSKAKDMIDFLKAQGFNSRSIYHVPRVLCHKQATLEERIAELKKVRPILINLQNLCRNKKDYFAFLNKIL